VTPEVSIIGEKISELQEQQHAKICEERNIDVRHVPHKYFLSYGLLSIAATLEHNGFKVNILQQDYLENENRWEQEFKEKVENSFLVGATAMTSNYIQGCKALKKAKEINPSIITMTGGFHPTFKAREAIEDGADVVVIREGENTVLELAQKIENGRNIEAIRGTAVRTKKGKIKANPGREFMDLDDKFLPAFHLLEPNLINQAYANLFYSFGCCFRCNFCMEYRFGGNLRYKSTERFILEMEEYSKYVKGNVIRLGDNSFTTNRKKAFEFFKEVPKRFPGYYFSCDARVDTFDKKMLEGLDKSNFIYVLAGLETGSEKMLKIMNKNQTVKQYIAILERTKDKIPFLHAPFMLAFRGEDLNTFSDTLKVSDFLLDKKLVYSISPRIFIPSPGQPEFEHPEKFGMEILTHDWNKYVRASFPVHRLKELSEFEIWGMYKMLLYNNLKHYARWVGREKELFSLFDSIPVIKGQYHRKLVPGKEITQSSDKGKA